MGPMTHIENAIFRGIVAKSLIGTQVLWCMLNFLLEKEITEKYRQEKYILLNAFLNTLNQSAYTAR